MISEIHSDCLHVNHIMLYSLIYLVIEICGFSVLAGKD